jgi:hypothetical protein
MAVGRFTNRGRELFAGHNFNATSLGLDNNGSAQPSFWVALIRNISGLFTAVNDGPNVAWNTVAQLQAVHAGAFVFASGNYTDHDIPVGTFTVTRNDGLGLVEITFATGQEPLLTWTNSTPLADAGGWALMTKQNPVAGSDIVGIFPAQAPILNVPQNYRIKVRDFRVFTQSV